MTVYDLNQDQLDELKVSYFWQDEAQDIVNSEEYVFYSDIPDDVIFAHYDGIDFSDDDFFCTAEM